MADFNTPSLAGWGGLRSPGAEIRSEDLVNPEAVHRYMELLTSLGGATFLCVTKDCGPQGNGTLSFPMRGTSFALDLPISSGIQDVINRLSRFLLEVGGRVYLAKDNFTRAEDFRAMEPRLEHFNTLRRQWDPVLRFRSAQSIRLFGDPRR